MDWLLIIWLFLICLLVFIKNPFYWLGTALYTLMLGIGFLNTLDLLFVISMVVAAIFILVGGVLRLVQKP